MGHSLPIPTDVLPEPRAGRDTMDATLMTTGDRRGKKAQPVPADEPAPPAVSTPAAAILGAPDSFSAAIVRSKVRAPDMRPYILERPRLLKWLDEHARQRVRVITAEAGYGKSTLVADHAKRTGRRFAWYRLEATDADWQGMLSYVVASVREVLPEFGTGAVNLLQRVGVLNATRDMVLDMVLAELESSVTDPLTLVLDDFHAVQDGDDVRAVVERLVELAPPTVNFVILGRRHLGPLLSRPMGQGQVAELGTQELRFTRTETAHLFAIMLGGPLEDDLVQVLDERLAGWCASLRLVADSLVDLSPAQTRASIEDLNVRAEPLYDFLAGQVLHRQSSAIRRVLSVASILEVVEPTLVLAAMARTGQASRVRIEGVLAEAEESGVVSRTSPAGRRWRFHPLVRDFMSSELLEHTNRRRLQEMHLRVAKAAEPIEWAASAHHYIEAEHRPDAMRVLRESAIQALGTANWGVATALADRMPDQPVPEAVTVIRAYGMAANGQARRAVTVLEGLRPSRDDAMAWGLTHAALASLYLVMGHLEGVRQTLNEMAGHEALAPVLVSVAGGIAVILETHEGGHLSRASEVLEEMAREQANLGLTYFAGVSYHNASLAALARGRYEASVALAKQAVSHFDHTPSKHGIESSHAVLALSFSELGQLARVAEHVEHISANHETPADALADAAWIAAAKGATDTAWVLIERASSEAIEGSGAHAAIQYSRVLAHLVDGNLEAASHILAGADDGSVELDAIARHHAMQSLLALLSRDPTGAGRAADVGLAVAESQGAFHWARWLRVLKALAESDGGGFRRALVTLAASAKLSTLILADAIALGMGLAGGTPAELMDLMKMWPERWLPALRRAVQSSDRAAGMAAADLLSTLGTVDDVVLLSEFERKNIRQPARRVLSRRLARHANPTLVVHDLGRLRLQVGHRVVPLSQSRRKAASLLAFLASRPEHSATRDQVLEAMWPGQSPEGAANSLHQTLFFLRREIDPWFEDGHSVDYIVVEPDVVYLDPELVLVDSAAFFRQVSAVLAGDNLGDAGAAILRDYRARFALDFEYEDWSSAWRDQVHGLYLEATEATADALLSTGRNRPAVDVIERALAIDPSALELEATLVVALHRQGATAAAIHQYNHYAKSYEDESGERPPSLSRLVQTRALPPK